MDENNKYVQNLIDGSKKKNVKSYYQLISMYIDSVFTLLLRLSNDYDLTASLTKNVFLFAWNNIQQIRMNSAFITWIHGIAIHNYLQHLRQNGFDKSTQHKAKESKPEKGAAPQLRLSAFDVALQNLNDRERLVLILCDVQKYSPSEVNDILPEMSVEEITALLQLARAKMAEVIKR